MNFNMKLYSVFCLLFLTGASAHAMDQRKAVFRDDVEPAANIKTQIFSAARRGDLTKMRMLCEFERDSVCDAIDHKCETPLRYAIMRGDYPMVKLLVHARVNLDGAAAFANQRSGKDCSYDHKMIARLLDPESETMILLARPALISEPLVR